MIENKEIKKQELKERIIDTKSINEPESLQSRKNKDDLFKIRGRIIILLLVLIAAVLVTLVLIVRYKRYNDFKLKWIKEISAGSIVGYEAFGNGYLKYSKDGALYLKPNGEDVWIESYEMSNPKIDKNGKYIIVFDIGGNKVESFNKNGRVATIETTLPILKAVVSQTGIVTALVEDSASTYIMFFKKDGTKLDISVKSKLSGDGYPTDIALSPDGTALMAAYQHIKGSTLMGRIVFYDFSEIGQNKPNRVVGGFDEGFDSSLIAKVKYLDRINSVAIASDGLYFFSSKNVVSPKLVKTIKAEENIEAIDFDGKNICVVYKNFSEEYNHTLCIYSHTGKEILKKNFLGEFKKLDMQSGYIYMTKDDKAIIMNKFGVIKYSGTLDVNIQKIMKNSLFAGFTVLSNNDFRGVVLK